MGPEMKRLLDYIDGKEASDEFTRKLETEVRTVKNNEKWRLDYMTLEMRYRELFDQALERGMEQGLEQGIEQGIEKGIEQGIGQEKIQTALRMLKAGELPVEKISIYSGLTVEQVLNLKNSL